MVLYCVYIYISSSHCLQCAIKNCNYNIPTCVANITNWKATPKENHTFVCPCPSICLSLPHQWKHSVGIKGMRRKNR